MKDFKDLLKAGEEIVGVVARVVEMADTPVDKPIVDEKMVESRTFESYLRPEDIEKLRMPAGGHCGAIGPMINLRPVISAVLEDGQVKRQPITEISGECGSCHIPGKVAINSDEGLLAAVRDYLKDNNLGETSKNVEKPVVENKAEGELLRDDFTLPKVGNEDDDEKHSGGKIGVAIGDQIVIAGKTQAGAVYANEVIVKPSGELTAPLVVAVEGIGGQSVGDYPSKITADALIVGPGTRTTTDDDGKGGLTNYVTTIEAKKLVMLPGVKVVVGHLNCDELVILEGASLRVISPSKIGKVVSDGTRHSLTGGGYGVGEVGEEVVLSAREIRDGINITLDGANIVNYSAQFK